MHKVSCFVCKDAKEPDYINDVNGVEFFFLLILLALNYFCIFVTLFLSLSWCDGKLGSKKLILSNTNF
jgi:hypothetical protein